MRARRRVVIALAAVLALVLAGLVGVRVLVGGDRSHLRAAVDVVPRSALRVSFTDWAEVRARLGVPTTASPTSAQVDRLTSKGYDSDLTSVSSIDESTAALQEHFGFSPTTIEWEAYVQARAGSAMVVRMPDGFDFDAVRRHLTDLGFDKPHDSDGVWRGGIDLVAAIDPTITPELQYVAVLADKHLIVSSDTESYAADVAAVAKGDKPDLGQVASVRTLVSRTGDTTAAMLWPRDFACADLSMSSADADTQQQAVEAVAAAGGVSPLTGLVMALGSDRTFRTLMEFESDEQAKENLRPRAKLAVGEAIGRGGSFADDLRLTGSRTEGSTVVLTMKPKEKTGFVLSALSSGPVLFATC